MAVTEYKQYAWQDVRVRALGREFVGIRGVKYKRSSDDDFLHGRGKKPIAIQSGNETCEGEIVLLQNELEALTSAVQEAFDVNLLNVSFDLVVTYQPSDDGDVVTDLIQSVKCGEYEKGMNQGDKYMEITIPFKALDILENV